MVSSRIVQLVWIHGNKAMKTPKNQNTNMHLYGKNLTSVYWFKALELVFLIQESSLMSQEGDRTDILPWIALQVCFQYWSFSWKFQVCLWLFCVAWRPKARGFALYLCMEGFRLRIWSKESRNWWNNIWFSMPLFSNLFHAILVQIMFNHQDTFQTWFARNIE